MLKRFALLLLFTATTLHAAPTAKEILATVRLQQAQQDIAVQGQLREDGKIVPFRLTQTGPVIRYSFSNPDEALQLRLGESDSKLEEITGDGVDKISGPEFDQKVRGTAITYADLVAQVSLLAERATPRRRNHQHAALLETAVASAVAAIAVRDRHSLGR